MTPSACRKALCAFIVLALTLPLGRPAPSAFAQTPGFGTLQVTVVDPSGAVIVGATVTVAGAEDATRAAGVAPLRTSDVGIAQVSGLALGRYSIKAEFPGFETGLLKEIRVRGGQNKQVVVLPLPRVETAVTVEQDRQAAAADPRARTFEVVSDAASRQHQLQVDANVNPGALLPAFNGPSISWKRTTVFINRETRAIASSCSCKVRTLRIRPTMSATAAR